MLRLPPPKRPNAVGAPLAARYRSSVMWRRDRNTERSGPAGEPTLDQFDEMVRAAYQEIPELFRRHTQDILLRVEDEADSETLRGLGLSSPYGLLGLYRGIPHGEKSISHNAPPVDTIYLYRRPILREAHVQAARVEDVIWNTLVHEIGHHFGFSDADMERIEHGD